MFATSQEQPFLEAIADNPVDDTPRLIYADWLDEQGDRRGEYLRFEMALSSGELSQGDSDYLPQAFAMRDLLEDVDRGWVMKVGKPFDLVMTDYNEASRVEPKYFSTIRTGDLSQSAETRMLRHFFAGQLISDEELPQNVPLEILRGATWYDAMAVNSSLIERSFPHTLEVLHASAQAEKNVLDASMVICINNLRSTKEKTRELFRSFRVPEYWSWQHCQSSNTWFKTFSSLNLARKTEKLLAGKLGAEVELTVNPALQFAMESRYLPFLESYFGDTHWTW